MTDGESPLDQFYATNPQQLFSSDCPNLILDTMDVSVLQGHLQCAAAELPVKQTVDFKFFGSSFDLFKTVCDEFLIFDRVKDNYVYDRRKYNDFPAKQIVLRSHAHENEQDSQEERVFRVVNVFNMSDIEDVPISRVPFTLYEGLLTW